MHSQTRHRPALVQAAALARMEEMMDRSGVADAEAKAQARTMWGLGDYHRFATETVWGLGPVLVEACGISPGDRVLDVAAGSGNVAIRAAESGARVVASDLTPENLESGRRAADAQGLELDWVEADAEALPFDDAEFDVVTSAVGAIFAPNQQAVANEIVRVCRPGGTIGMINFTPEGLAAEFFGLFGKYAPPSEAPPPVLWGSEEHVRQPRSLQADPVVAERFSRDSMRLGGILTAMVTPFDAEGGLDEGATVRLMRHLLENGSDGLVLAGSTGEGATMTDEEKVRLWELGVAESGDAPIIAGTGTYDTRHSVELTERAHEVGVDAMLVVTPYYVRPNRRGIRAHYEAVAAATDRPIVAYNIPSRTATDMPNDLLAELAQIENVAAVKQARYEDMAPIEGMDLLAGNDDVLAKVMDMGGTGGILVASNLIGAEMRRIIDEPERRHEIEDGLRDLYKAMTVTVNPIPVKTAVNMIGLDAGPLRLPLVEASEEERAVIREALERHNLLAAV